MLSQIGGHKDQGKKGGLVVCDRIPGADGVQTVEGKADGGG